ncbi:unnamed protein product [Spirodela intermedia]|uniref:Uncharacterized protein n=2 Tax=Spirodela intermedia TaxID=51605 RepID=A0A7I8IXI3_SPIIN|nr:unnamed protein product [Spirodela intermedia]CAA6662715.1 unnamed protein product [Spirodela intermedia]CAA7399125.1 unnamed protein product [Spirodela intermedia]
MALLNDLLNLDLADSTEEIIAEYIWDSENVRSKARVSISKF